MVVPQFLETIESSGFSTWLRETPSVFGFYFVLTLHTIGLAMLVGPSAAIDLRILGVASDLPLAPLKNWFRLMWIGFAINSSTGLFLLIAYPTKALTNPVFYLKLALIASSVLIMAKIRDRVFDDANPSESVSAMRGKKLAICSLVLWVGAITAGRLLAYTYTYILYGIYSHGS